MFQQENSTQHVTRTITLHLPRRIERLWLERNIADRAVHRQTYQHRTLCGHIDSESAFGAAASSPNGGFSCGWPWRPVQFDCHCVHDRAVVIVRALKHNRRLRNASSRRDMASQSSLATSGRTYQFELTREIGPAWHGEHPKHL